jgi:hypothetical protein
MLNQRFGHLHEHKDANRARKDRVDTGICWKQRFSKSRECEIAQTNTRQAFTGIASSKTALNHAVKTRKTQKV